MANKPTTIETAETDDILERTLEEIVFEEMGGHTKPLIKRLAKYVLKCEASSSLALLREVSEQVIGENQEYSRQAQAVIDRRNADPMCKTPYPREARWKDERNRLKAEQRKALSTLKKKYGGENATNKI